MNHKLEWKASEMKSEINYWFFAEVNYDLNKNYSQLLKQTLNILIWKFDY